MKNLILSITLVLSTFSLQSCQPEYIKTYTCGKVIERQIIPHESSTTYKIIYEEKNGKRHYITDYDDINYTQYIIGDNFCEVKLIPKN